MISQFIKAANDYEAFNSVEEFYVGRALARLKILSEEPLTGWDRGKFLFHVVGEFQTNFSGEDHSV